MNAPAPTAHASLPLAQLLVHAAAAVQAVRGGQSLTDALERCPGPARPGAQALSFHALRWMGGAQAVREQLVPKAPPPALDALLLTALALLWPGSEPLYAEHTLVDQAVVAAKQRGGFVNAVLRRFLRERDALLAGLQANLVARYNHPRWWVERMQRDWPDDWQAVLAANQQRAPMTLRVNARKEAVARYQTALAAMKIIATPVATQGLVLEHACAPTMRLDAEWFVVQSDRLDGDHLKCGCGNGLVDTADHERRR